MLHEWNELIVRVPENQEREKQSVMHVNYCELDKESSKKCEKPNLWREEGDIFKRMDK